MEHSLLFTFHFFIRLHLLCIQQNGNYYFHLTSIIFAIDLILILGSVKCVLKGEPLNRNRDFIII